MFVKQPNSSAQLTVSRWRDGEWLHHQDAVPSEQAVALVYNGVSHAVMMATPDDLEDFALGFSLTEGIVAKASEIYSVTIELQPKGIELQIQLSSERFAQLKSDRRRQVGVSGCGLCGAESLEAAIRPVEVSRLPPGQPALARSAVLSSLKAFERQQVLRAETGGIHAAAWCGADGTIHEVREDIGRHNAVDKLLGAIARSKTVGNAESVIETENAYLLLSSRISFEIVQKAASLKIRVIVAVSTPTSLALSYANDAGICIIGRASKQQLVVYTHSAGVNFE